MEKFSTKFKADALGEDIDQGSPERNLIASVLLRGLSDVFVYDSVPQHLSNKKFALRAYAKARSRGKYRVMEGVPKEGLHYHKQFLDAYDWIVCGETLAWSFLWCVGVLFTDDKKTASVLVEQAKKIKQELFDDI